MRLHAIALATAGVFVAGGANALTVTSTDNAATLTSSILGPGVSLVGAPTLTAATGAAGTFSNGTDSVPFSNGIVLSSGLVSEIPGTNASGPESLGVGASGDDDLNTSLGSSGDAAITGSFDAASLEFTFQFGDGSVGGDLNFGFVFASEEYIDFVNSGFNDEFQLLINGTDVALVAGQKVNINNVNPNSNSSFYVNNVANDGGFPVANLGMKFDGRTTFLVASALGLPSGQHTAKFVVADVGDSALDSAVFIQAGSFNPDQPRPDEGVIPVPAALPLLATGLLGLGAVSRRRRRKT